MDIDIGYKKTKFGGMNNIKIYKKQALSQKAAFVSEMLIRWGVIASSPDGEDSAGRAKGKLYPVNELVSRACNIADAAWFEFEKRGWLLTLPEPTELD